MSREEVEDECREQRPSARESVNKREEMEVGASWDRPRETVSPSGGLIVADDERATGDGAGTKPESAPIGRSKALPPPPCVVELGRGGEGVVDVGAPSTGIEQSAITQPLHNAAANQRPREGRGGLEGHGAHPPRARRGQAWAKKKTPRHRFGGDWAIRHRPNERMHRSTVKALEGGGTFLPTSSSYPKGWIGFAQKNDREWISTPSA
ncbi:hypothetical protein B0H10DRAFT_2277278 [Mycena sp. CBHHK59/15]|nr:hypothetical protein B0H10DRAFT_2277278 [Mycena sp. CBHHK59/15]